MYLHWNHTKSAVPKRFLVFVEIEKRKLQSWQTVVFYPLHSKNCGIEILLFMKTLTSKLTLMHLSEHALYNHVLVATMLTFYLSEWNQCQAPVQTTYLSKEFYQESLRKRSAIIDIIAIKDIVILRSDTCLAAAFCRGKQLFLLLNIGQTLVKLNIFLFLGQNLEKLNIFSLPFCCSDK